ncbi:hypothetical protein TSTA_001400 [Talaromyces stipitatus ATCC 10500]|uniref:Reverse transcriptase/retrotransposon-derived protein RNase H-like domain-containing protein n=1 Tax=Talaromyces stipitatus (strain ATCC 10500 / CBS 375.48 / QM 6759 / NRRL 1006) TaxID=441959 RepID=B8MSI9_TALSN|nr:uncharacterized protein TSTA_001400 [Talaromyces stipitatus ATCC 10500]EED12069.1 hypothetical protein TSTA_001400 [Talaromyces stipitatus ATCC 10500]
MTEFNDDCKEAWDTLKDILAKAPVRFLPDLTKPFLLYTDGSKEFSFEAALHQVDKNKVATAIWVIIKLRQYLDKNKFTLYTDHATRDSLNGPYTLHTNQMKKQAEPENPIKNRFKLDTATRLLYMIWENIERLCILAKAHKLILMATHDYKGHPSIQKI